MPGELGPSSEVGYDHTILDELFSLRFIDAAHNVMIMGPVGVGKTSLAAALGHAAVRHRYTAHFERSDRLLKRLKASRLDNSHDAEIRKLLRVDLLILDDFALQALDSIDTADIYELIVERHRRGDDHHLQPGTGWVALADGRPAARPIRDRPAPVRRPRTRPRRAQLPAQAETQPPPAPPPPQPKATPPRRRRRA